MAVGKGHAWSWVEADNGNNPVNIGISFEKNAFVSLPDSGKADDYEEEYEYILPLPAQTILPTFNTVVINWNPHGHTPVGIYDKPHFDLHFYMMTESERVKIPEYEADSAKFLNYPAAAYLPATYIPIPHGEPRMGTHWADATSPELSPSNPQPFTQTFIYGSYNGNVTFYEPMATLAFLTTTSFYTRDIPQPAKFNKDGYYPTRMSVTDKGSTMQITLHNFVYHTKS